MLAKTDKEAQIEMSHEIGKSDRNVFEIEPVCGKLKREKFGLKSDEIKIEESKKSGELLSKN